MEFELWTNIQIDRLIRVLRNKAGSEKEYKYILDKFTTLCAKSINTYNESYELESELKTDIIIEVNSIINNLNSRIELSRI